MTRTVSNSHRDQGKEEGGVETIRPMYRASDVAKILGCSRSKVYRLADANELPGAQRMGRSVMVRPEPFERFMAGDLDVADWQASRQKPKAS